MTVIEAFSVLYFLFNPIKIIMTLQTLINLNLNYLVNIGGCLLLVFTLRLNDLKTSSVPRVVHACHHFCYDLFLVWKSTFEALNCELV
jgi:hypothetical protein